MMFMNIPGVGLLDATVVISAVTNMNALLVVLALFIHTGIRLVLVSLPITHRSYPVVVE